MSWVRRLAVPGYAFALTLLIFAPLLTPGYLLLRDAVSTPRSYLTDAALGLTEAAPRAVPQDFLIAALSPVIDGGLLVKLLLFGALLTAGVGAGRLAQHVLPAAGLPGALVAVTAATWNPYIAERLLQGHWSLLVGYGCLPWVALAMIRLRTTASGMGALAAAIAAAGLTPTGLLLASMVALTSVAVPGSGWSRLRCAATTAVVAVAVAAPWLLAAASSAGSMSGSAGAQDGPTGVAAFAARAEPGLATLGTLAGLGGIWNGEAVPVSRAGWFAAMATAIFLAIVLVGVRVAAANRLARPLLILAGAAVLLPALAATGPGLTLLQAAIEVAPGLGIMRDGHKWVALAVPGYSLAGAAVAGSISGRWPRVPAPVAAGLVCATLIAMLPDLAFGVGGQVRSVHYPAGWARVAAHVDADPGPVAVLPADVMRQFAFTGPAPVLDPLPRWLRAEVLSTGTLRIADGYDGQLGVQVPGEGEHARRVQQLLLVGADPARLFDAGVRWVVLERGSPGDTGASARTLASLPVTYQDEDLTLYRVGGQRLGADAGERSAMICAHLMWLAVLIGGAAAALRPALRRVSRVSFGGRKPIR